MFIPLLLPIRLQRLEHLAARFDHKVANIERWLDGKDTMLARNDDIEEANLAEVMVSYSLSISSLKTERFIPLVGENHSNTCLYCRIHCLFSLSHTFMSL